MPDKHVSDTRRVWEAFVGFGTPAMIEVAFLNAGVDPTDPDYFAAENVVDTDPLWDRGLGAFFGTQTFGLGQPVPDYLGAKNVGSFDGNLPALAPGDYNVWWRLTIGDERPVILSAETLTITEQAA